MDTQLQSIKFLNLCNFPISMASEFQYLLLTYPLPEKRLKLIKKLTPRQISGVISSHLMSIARKCGISSIYISKYSELKKDLSKKHNSKYVNDIFWKKHIEEAEKELPMETFRLIQAVKSSKIYKHRLHNLDIILKQESINKKIKKVKKS